MSTPITKPAPHSSLSNFMDLVAGITREMVEEWTIEHWQENTTQCKEALNDINLWRQIPLLNHVDEIEKYYEKVVRFRGMVQEICSPVYYLDQYVVLDHATNTRSFKSGKYRDTLACQENEEILVDSEENVHQERQVVFCIDIPSLNSWAYKISAKENQPEGLIDVTNDEINNTENSQTESQEKKNIIANGIDSNATSQDSDIEADGIKAEKRDENSACVINLYDNVDETVKMNDIIEVAGFLAVSLSQEINEQNSENDVQISFSNTPQLHVIAFRPTPYKFHDMLTLQEDEILRNAPSLKNELKDILTVLLGNDDLAANYFLCNLISSIFRRQDTFILGKFALNLTNIPTNACDGFYTNQIYDVIALLVEKSRYIPVEIDMFNRTIMTPRRDNENEKFESGLLQLSSGTHLVVDETKLQPGRLQQNGIDSLAAISGIIKDQKVDFDFDYCKTEMPTDLPVLILSHNKSLFPNDWLVALKPDDGFINDMNTCVQQAKQRLCEPLLSQLRIYLDVVRPLHYELPPDMCKMITEDYVKLRQEGDIAVLKQDLNKLLVLARLISLSNGCGDLKKEYWEEALELERRRKSRLSEEDI